MAERLNDLFDEYDELSSDVEASNYKMLKTNLARWFSFIDSSDPFLAIVASLEGQVDFVSWYAECSETIGSMVGSGRLEFPSERRARLGLELKLLRAFATGTIDVADFCSDFMYRENDFDIMVNDVVSQLFRPSQRELRRFVGHQVSASSMSLAPASDRIVRHTDNLLAFEETSKQLVELENALRDTNSYSDLEDRGQRMGEVAAGRALISAGRARLSAVVTVLVPSLKYLADKFADQAVGAIAGLALTALLAWLGLSLF